METAKANWKIQLPSMVVYQFLSCFLEGPSQCSMGNLTRKVYCFAVRFTRCSHTCVMLQDTSVSRSTASALATSGFGGLLQTEKDVFWASSPNFPMVGWFRERTSGPEKEGQGSWPSRR